MWNLRNVPHLSLSSPAPFSPADVWDLLNINLMELELTPKAPFAKFKVFPGTQHVNSWGHTECLHVSISNIGTLNLLFFSRSVNGHKDLKEANYVTQIHIISPSHSISNTITAIGHKRLKLHWFFQGTQSGNLFSASCLIINHNKWSLLKRKFIPTVFLSNTAHKTFY